MRLYTGTRVLNTCTEDIWSAKLVADGQTWYRAPRGELPLWGDKLRVVTVKFDLSVKFDFWSFCPFIISFLTVLVWLFATVGPAFLTQCPTRQISIWRRWKQMTNDSSLWALLLDNIGMHRFSWPCALFGKLLDCTSTKKSQKGGAS